MVVMGVVGVHHNLARASRTVLNIHSHIGNQFVNNTLLFCRASSFPSKGISDLTRNINNKPRNVPDQSYRNYQIQKPGSALNEPLNPFRLVEEDLEGVFHGIRKALLTENDEFNALARYFFDGHGKSIRPSLVLMASRAINEHFHPNQGILLKPQKDIAMILEMVHTSSLVHDDVIDMASVRRGKTSINELIGNHRAVLVGNFVIARASHILFQINSTEIVSYLSQVLMEMIRGELMQLQSKDEEDERFSDYLRKSFLKTASLIAYGLKSATMAVEDADESLQESMYQYGRNLGIAFQLIDDLLDYSSSQHIGKPAAADLKLGLATAPVLFACDNFPELNDMIKRSFSQPGDVDKAYDYVQRSDGLEQTKFLAQKHASEALRSLEPLKCSPYKTALCRMVEILLNRTK